jgi:hypothetical protein
LKEITVIEQWGIFELILNGPSEGNPFTDIQVSAQFSYQHRIIEINGFYDGDGIYRVRFMPDVAGEWRYQTSSQEPSLNGISGQFTCSPPTSKNHGPVHVRNTFHFAYADGTPYWPIGTTCYAWTHQTEQLEQQTLESLKNSPFNKIRMCVFPKHYTFNTNEPQFYPFEQTSDGWDFARFNPVFFQHFEQRVADLLALGIEADIILLHPYDRWGFARMSQEEDVRYLRYVVARLAAYRNVWWSMANEYDIMPKPLDVWDRLFQVVQESDPYHHLRSIHNWISLDDHRWHTFYDHTKPWVTHCSVQHAHVDLVPTWREQYRKPIVLDEVCYEGDLPNGWGNISAQEMTRRFWEGSVRGGYVGHGETYINPGDVIWWSKGGELRGGSPSRIAFLRTILENGPANGINPVGRITNTHMESSGEVGNYYLTYFGNRQPSQITFTLPEGRYQADIIDTWEMTIEPLNAPVENGTTITLPGKPFMAVRLQHKV